MQKKQIVVLGAGMVGVCSALALQKKGFKVTLIDKAKPGSETSFGNAGMITPSSLIPFNNPKLMGALPSFLRNKSTGFRYNFSYALSEISALLRFLSFSRKASADVRINHLYQLIERSIVLHKEQAETGLATLRETGWLKLYRSEKSYQSALYEQQVYADYNIQTQLLNAEQLQDKEPCLHAIYQRGVLIKDALSVASPQSLVKAYLEEFLRLGGEFVEQSITGIKKQQELWQLSTLEHELIECEQLVVAAGPWSKALLSQVGLHLPMIFERGGHREYAYTPSAEYSLKAPIHDVEGSFVATPVEKGVRISCGVELNHQQAVSSEVQLELVQRNAAQGFNFNQEALSQWHGARPTMPDSMPLIGATKLQGLWLNAGHQHIGFSTGPGCAEILAELMLSENVHGLNNAFCPSRFKL